MPGWLKVSLMVAGLTGLYLGVITFVAKVLRLVHDEPNPEDWS